jgi:hypothetical protein
MELERRLRLLHFFLMTMKTISILAAFLILGSSHIAAQTANDSTGSRHRPKQHRFGFMDQNGDGIQDKKLNCKKDRFIDSNGDGICDERERGLGFQRCTTQQQNQHGKKQKGKK